MAEKLQSEIKQSKPFPRASAEAFLSILRTAALLEHQIGEVLRPHGITTTQYNVLRILKGAGSQGLCGREIAERLVSRVPDVSRLLDRMEELGLLTRKRDSEDRRHVTARITNQGLKIIEKATPDLEAVESSRFRNLPAESVQSLIETLDDVRAGG
jgi:DNA-binding MarR family transcriptional regulator